MEPVRKNVTITGISGYLGAQVCYYFLKSGGFNVTGTVRSKTNEKKIAPLKKAFGEYFDKLTLVEADLLDEESMIKACEGANFIVHTASPFPIAEPKNADDLIKPAVNGTLAIMKAAKKNKVEKVVITSSIAAIYETGVEGQTHFSAADWTNVEKLVGNAYVKSKTLAEKAAWDFQAQLPESERFPIVTINPGFIIGPNLNECFFSSGDVFKKIMTGGFPGMPRLQMPIVDVRDVAEAHLNATLRDEANNQRFIMTGESLWFTELGETLYERYANNGYPSCVRNQVFKPLLWFVSFFDGEAAQMYKLWGRTSTFDTTPAKEVLGIKFIPSKLSALDMAETLIETGVVPDQRINK